MKSPDEIKKGLAVCATLDGDCENCPYDDGKQLACVDRSRRDALAYIQQLEERNEKLENALRNLASSSSNARDAANKVIEDLKSRLAQVERERDAAIVDMRSMAVEDICNLCARIDEGYIPMPPHCKYANDGDCFRWRGVCPENTKEET